MRKWIYVVSALMTLALSGCHVDRGTPAQMVSTAQSQPMGEEKSLAATIRLATGSLEVVTSRNSEDLYGFELDYDKANYRPQVSFVSNKASQAGELTLALDSMHNVHLPNASDRNRLNVGFNGSVPLKLRITTGLADAKLALSGLQVAEMELESGVGGARLSAYEPNPVRCKYVRLQNGMGSIRAVGLGNLHFQRLEFEGGVGGADLDFSGDWNQDAEVTIQVGVGGVSVRMPREVGVRVETEKHFLSGMHLDGFKERDGFHYSEAYDKAPYKVTIRVSSGVGGLRVTWL